ncbi:hypothetical protein [Amycolatopsis sp. cmx-11-32]|uniref:hypothetical protein n=1 Tax=Amycolatopsis sp. cmx-11-32 TaxID=2785796 RepID=UPI0039E5B2D9
MDTDARHAAYSCRWEGLTGRLAQGLAADFVVLDRDPWDYGSWNELVDRNPELL